MLTIDGGVIVAVSCCTALSFSTLDIAIAEHLLSLLIYVGGQTVGILQTLNEYPDGGCIIHEITSFSLCLESMDIHCKGLLILLLDVHEM